VVFAEMLSWKGIRSFQSRRPWYLTRACMVFAVDLKGVKLELLS
jgi:hypothetical protein